MQLRNIYLFEGIDDETLIQIEKISKVEELNSKNILFYEGEKANYMYFLLEGTIKLYKTSSTNKIIVMKYFKENEFIAEVANFEEIDYPASAEAISKCKVLKIDFIKFKKLILSNEKLSYLIMQSLIKKIRNLENVISLNIQLEAKEKLAKYICEKKQTFFLEKNIHIAEYLNITPETLSRVLKVFKNNNLIDIKNKKIDYDKIRLFFK